MHLGRSDLTLAQGLVYVLSQHLLFFLGQLLGTGPVMLVEATLAVTLVTTTLLLLTLEDVEDLLDVHVVKAAIKQPDLLAVDLGHGDDLAFRVTLNDG